MNMKDLFIVIDVETDGKIPGDSNLLTLGAVPVVFDAHADRFGIGAGGENFYLRLSPRPGVVSEKETMKWWHEQDPAMFHEAFLETPRVPPGEAIGRFRDWVIYLRDTYKPDETILAAGPIMFDGGWVRWYMEHYLGSCDPLSYRGVDIKSFWVGGAPNRTFAEANEHGFYEQFAQRPTDCPQHHALHDAVYEAYVFSAMLNRRDKRR